MKHQMECLRKENACLRGEIEILKGRENHNFWTKYHCITAHLLFKGNIPLAFTITSFLEIKYQNRIDVWILLTLFVQIEKMKSAHCLLNRFHGLAAKFWPASSQLTQIQATETHFFKSWKSVNNVLAIDFYIYLYWLAGNKLFCFDQHGKSFSITNSPN